MANTTVPNLNSNLRILQLIHKPQNRGAETFACQLSNHLVELGHEVEVVAIYKGNATLPFNGKIANLAAVPEKRFFDFRAWKKLSGIIKAYKPDVIQANAGDTLKYVIFSKLFYNWKVPVIFRNASEVGQYLSSPFQKGFNRFLYTKVDAVISVSQASERDILQHFSFLKGKTEVIPVGLESLKIEDEVNLNSEKKHIVHIGGFTFEKNHRGLLKIFKLINAQKPDVHLHLLGDGPLRKDIEKEVAHSGLEKKISFYGFVNNPLAYIRAADVLVLPSIIEGLPGVLLEAMYCRKPVVAYNVGGIPEIINGETGSLIEKDNEPAFAEAVLAALDHPDELQKNHAYEMVQTRFMNDQLALKFVNSYQNFAAQPQ